MAYIKGGSVVDGNLYIEGGLVVRNISTSAGGKLPTLDDGDTNSDRLVKFKNYNGGLQYSSFGETVSTVSDTGKSKKGVNLYVGETKDEFNTLGLSFGKTNKAEVFTITNAKGDATEIEKIDINTPASKIMVIDKGIKGIINNVPSDIYDGFIDSINENTEISEIPESFSYSEN